MFKMLDGRDYRNTAADLYMDAQEFGAEMGNQEIGAAYWVAWYAGRQASGALLHEAKDMGLTEEQLERLREVAAKVAYD
jgi:hypothetical protein